MHGTKCEPAGSRRPISVDAVRRPFKHLRRNHRGGGLSECTHWRNMSMRCSSWRNPRMSLIRSETSVEPDIVRLSTRGRGMTGSSASLVRSVTTGHLRIQDPVIPFSGVNLGVPGVRHPRRKIMGLRGRPGAPMIFSCLAKT